MAQAVGFLRSNDDVKALGAALEPVCPGAHLGQLAQPEHLPNMLAIELGRADSLVLARTSDHAMPWRVEFKLSDHDLERTASLVEALVAVEPVDFQFDMHTAPI